MNIPPARYPTRTTPADFGSLFTAANTKFYDKTFTYYDHAGMVYWTMGEPIGETIIINRCRKKDTYEIRRLNGTLPGS